MPGIMDPLGQVAQLLGVHRTTATSGGSAAVAGVGKPPRGDASLVNVSHSGSALADMASRLQEVGFVHDPQGANHEDHQRHKEHETKDEHRLKEFRETDEHKAQRHDREKELSDTDIQEIHKLKETDAKVKTHEMAHKTAAGSLASGGPYYDYEQGPDGVSYAVSGHVPLHLPETSDPEQALRDSEQAYRAALAPADPSSADRAAAAQFSSRATQARQEIASSRQEKSGGQESMPRPGHPPPPKDGARAQGAEDIVGPPPEHEPPAKAIEAHLHPEFLLGPGLTKLES